MELTTTTPQKKLRHNPQQHKGRRRESPTAGTSNVREETGDPLQNQLPRLPSNQNNNSVISDAFSSPMTPPRPRSMYEGTFPGQQSGVASGSDSNTRRRKPAQAAQNQRSKPVISNARLSDTRSKSQKNMQTPGKSSTPPSQAYAGPTFHASPAPSSLPIPKFFQKNLSKSVPETSQAKGLAAMMECENSEEAPSPESDEASPVRQKAERLQQQIREESPLDIFFRADREEKTRARLVNITNQERLGTPDGEAEGEVNLSNGTHSPLPDLSRHHSRQHTGSSTGGLFPIDVEQDKPPIRSTQSHNSSALPSHTSDRSHTNPPTATVAREDDEARRIARSADLMKLLGTEKPKKPNSSLPGIHHISTMESPKPAPSSAHKPTSSSSATSHLDTKIQILSRNQPASLPQLQRQFGLPPLSHQSPRARPQSSLRQEVPAPLSPAQDNLPELPATPTPSRTSNPPSKSHENKNLFPKDTSSPSHTSAFPGVPSSSAQDPKFLSMENDLRRILRLENVL